MPLAPLRSVPGVCFMLGVCFVLGVCFMLASSGSLNQVYGQSPPPTGFPALEQAISTGFYAPGSTGNDWCFQMESDPNENAWNFINKKKIYPHVIDYAARVRFIFTDSDGKPNFGSIFMGFDLLMTTPYDLTIFLEKKNDKVSSATRDNLPVITIPNNTNNPAYSNCVPMANLFPRMFYPYVMDWKSQGNPNCDDIAGTCTGVAYTSPDDGKTQYYIDRQTSTNDVSDTTSYATWSFNGRPHKIPRAIRFFVLVKGKPAYFTVGYGGSGGAA
jgi:hypothetical protein